MSDLKLTVDLTGETADRINTYLTADGVKKSEFLRKACETYLKIREIATQENTEIDVLINNLRDQPCGTKKEEQPENSDVKKLMAKISLMESVIIDCFNSLNKLKEEKSNTKILTKISSVETKIIEIFKFLDRFGEEKINSTVLTKISSVESKTEAIQEFLNEFGDELITNQVSTGVSQVRKDFEVNFQRIKDKVEEVNEKSEENLNKLSGLSKIVRGLGGYTSADIWRVVLVSVLTFVGCFTVFGMFGVPYLTKEVNRVTRTGVRKELGGMFRDGRRWYHFTKVNGQLLPEEWNKRADQELDQMNGKTEEEKEFIRIESVLSARKIAEEIPETTKPTNNKPRKK